MPSLAIVELGVFASRQMFREYVRVILYSYFRGGLTAIFVHRLLVSSRANVCANGRP